MSDRHGLVTDKGLMKTVLLLEHPKGNLLFTEVGMLLFSSLVSVMTFYKSHLTYAFDLAHNLKEGHRDCKLDSG